MSRAGRDVPDGLSVPVSKDRKISGANSKPPDVDAASKNLESLSLNHTKNTCDHGSKNKAIPCVQQSNRGVAAQPDRARPARVERLEDVFQDEIVKRFPKMSEFKKFARSGKGLRLSEYDVENVIEDYRSGEEQRMQMLSLWRQKMGRNATPQKIRELVDGFIEVDEDGY